MILIVLTGHPENPEIELDSIFICMNLNGWEVMIALGFNVAINVRVSNGLGVGHPNTAKFSVLVMTLTSLLIGIFFMILIFVTKNDFRVFFTNIQEVMHAVTRLATLLALRMILNNEQSVLSGVAVGAGWQALVAYVNIGCYYVIGLPIGILLGYKNEPWSQGYLEWYN